MRTKWMWRQRGQHYSILFDYSNNVTLVMCFIDAIILKKNNFTPLDANGPLCMILEFLHYYFWMATCSWGCLESIQVLHAYYFSMSGYLNMAWLCIIGWIGPLLLIVSWSICKFESSNTEPLECWPTDAVQCDWWLITFPIFSMLVIGLMWVIHKI